MSKPEIKTVTHTNEGRLDNIWAHHHRHRIKAKLDGATTDQLRQIAAIVDYDPVAK